MLQMRPVNAGADAPYYTPERDIAHVWPALLRSAMQLLEVANRTPEIAAFMRVNKINDRQLGQACKLLGETLNTFIENTEVRTVKEALELTGYLNVGYPVRRLIHSMIGDILLGGIFVGIRQVTERHGDPPCRHDMAEYLATGLIISGRLSGITEVEPTEEFVELVELRAAEARAKLRDEENQGRILALQTQLLETKQQLKAALAGTPPAGDAPHAP